MIFIGRKNIKLFKLFLVSSFLEKFLLLLFIIFLPLIAFYPENFSTYSDLDLSESLLISFNEKNFSKISNKSEFYTWAREYVIPSYYTNAVTPNMALKSIRFRQYRYPCNLDDTSSECLEKVKNYKENAQSFLPQNLQSISCVYSSCEEFQWRYVEEGSDMVEGKLGSYPMFGFRVELGQDQINAQKNLNKLEKNNWIDSKTVGLLLEANYFNFWKEKYVIFRGLLEFHGEKHIVQNTFSYNIVTYYYNSNVILFIFLMFVIQTFLYLFKIMFEMTIICNRIMALGQISHLGCQLAFIIVFSIKLTYLNKDSPENQANSIKDFIYLYNIAVLDNFCKFMLFLIFIFYPFKIFQLISWSKYMSFLVKFWVTIYRTLPGISLYFILISLIVLSWGLGFMIIFQDFLPQFRDYGSTILSMFTIDFGSIGDYDLQLLAGTFNETFYFIYFLQCLSFVLIIVYFFAILSDLFHRSATLEYNQPSPNEKETQEKLEEMQFKFDRFIKELRKEFNKDKKDLDDNLFSHNQNKILIWLDCSKGLFTVYEDVMIELTDYQVQCRRFIHKEEVIQFLDYLFKLKPNLLSFRAGERFRIVAENYTNYNNQGDWRSVELLIDWLKHVGCRVPILIYSDVKLQRDVLIYLKKIYPSILFVYDMEKLKRYCSMADSIYAFYEGLNKQENKDKIDEGDSFSEEESFFE